MRTKFGAGLVGAMALVVATGAKADDCADLFAAATAQAKTPYDGTVTTVKKSGETTKNEVVVLGAKMYIQVAGAWQSMPYDAQGTADDMMAKAKATKPTCQKVGSDTVNGEATTVFTEHAETPRGASDVRLWVSDSRHLPLKMEIHLPSGDVITQETHYDNVKAPAGVN